jgi:hypothetical protein
MFNPAPPPLDPQQGETLSLNTYLEAFREQRARPYGSDSWTLESQGGRSFKEERSFTRDELRRYHGPVRAFSDEHCAAVGAADLDACHGARVHRARIVRELTPAVREELLWLKQRNDSTRVLETSRPVPDVMSSRGLCLYEISTGPKVVCYRDKKLIEAWETYIQRLYIEAEDVHSYFRRRENRPPIPVPEKRTPEETCRADLPPLLSPVQGELISA